ncbi:hypothetical protein CF111_08750 [Aeromonas sobria]|uniref:hypothetical protein n=1 Tax=Aeromonas sobria TaxID=646 RepID=UPI0011186313|nr:hypothetical protein [Aeromonas sobria]TNJ24199.1 hypothetical protein CF111_08750 [Aeromonas sobria]
MSLTQLAARLPSVALARLLLALLLICNLTLCISWHGAQQAFDASSRQTASLPHNMAMSSGEMAEPMAMMDHQNSSAPLSCHQGMGDEAAMSGECQMQTGISAAASALPLFGMLISLFILPLLLLPSPGATSHRLDLWLRDPFLRSRGSHPPSWPRRHLMLSVLRH